MAKDLRVVVDDRPGAGQAGRGEGGAGSTSKGVCCLATGGGTAPVHILVEDVTATRSALQNARLEVSDERDVIVVDVPDPPGTMAQVARRRRCEHRAGVHNLRRVELGLGVDDVVNARAAV
jgi:hypothetical protein